MDLLLVIGLLFAAIVLIFALVGVAAVFYPRLGSDNTLIVLPVQLLLYLFVYLIFRLLFLLRYDRPALHSLGWVPSSFR